MKLRFLIQQILSLNSVLVVYMTLFLEVMLAFLLADVTQLAERVAIATVI